MRQRELGRGGPGGGHILRGGSSHVAVSAISWQCQGTQEARTWKEGRDGVGSREN